MDKLTYIEKLREATEVLEAVKDQHEKVCSEMNKTMETLKEFMEFTNAAASVIARKLSEEETKDSNHIGSKCSN